MIPIGIIGASGFTGAELLRLTALHPEFELQFATGDSQAGAGLSELYPSLAGVYGAQKFVSYEPELLDEFPVEVVFIGLPHGMSQNIVPDLLDRVRVVVDLGADFRLRTSDDYAKWYGEAHTRPDLLDRFVYGLPEFHREQIIGASAIATPGCYPTTASLVMAPLVQAGLVKTDRIIVDAASGVSGAGRPPKPNTTFCTVDSDFTAYGLLDHRHTPEMEMNIGANVIFTPHLAPMSRGILATCYADPAVDGLSTADVMAALEDFYADEPFVVVSERSPSTKATLGSNSAHLTARVDQRTGTVIGISALDNLGKGASGAAIQCANLAMGIDETAGLPLVGTFP
ncbi:MAG TPA: N-acetyl-gamma-glutamyl-phosphate reductase [Microthrixaceae bacterium]|nr:N-acetyl-gamma-glutamyl-phosphate reductase [Microthrixaceae bacterium]